MSCKNVFWDELSAEEEAELEIKKKLRREESARRCKFLYPRAPIYYHIMGDPAEYYLCAYCQQSGKVKGNCQKMWTHVMTCMAKHINLR